MRKDTKVVKGCRYLALFMRDDVYVRPTIITSARKYHPGNKDVDRTLITSDRP